MGLMKPAKVTERPNGSVTKYRKSMRPQGRHPNGLDMRKCERDILSHIYGMVSFNIAKIIMEKNNPHDLLSEDGNNKIRVFPRMDLLQATAKLTRIPAVERRLFGEFEERRNSQGDVEKLVRKCMSSPKGITSPDFLFYGRNRERPMIAEAKFRLNKAVLDEVIQKYLNPKMVIDPETSDETGYITTYVLNRKGKLVHPLALVLICAGSDVPQELKDYAKRFHVSIQDRGYIMETLGMTREEYGGYIRSCMERVASWMNQGRKKRKSK